MKNIQISEKLFIQLVEFHLYNKDLCKKEIKTELNRKLESIINRQIYTVYKTASTKEVQEIARKKYLDRKGYHKDFRW